MANRATDPILLQREFYVPECITQALTDFQPYLSATAAADGKDILLSLQVAPAHATQAQQIIREFLNYLLDLSLRFRLDETRRSLPDGHRSSSTSGTGTR